MGDERLRELARGYAQNQIPLESYRARRAELLDALTAGTTTSPPGRLGESEPPWLDWLPLGVAGLALASTLFWILA